MTDRGCDVELADVDGTQHLGVANGGTLNISGSVVIDGTQATTDVQTGGFGDLYLSHQGDRVPVPAKNIDK